MLHHEYQNSRPSGMWPDDCLNLFIYISTSNKWLRWLGQVWPRGYDSHIAIYNIEFRIQLKNGPEHDQKPINSRSKYDRWSTDSIPTRTRRWHEDMNCHRNLYPQDTQRPHRGHRMATRCRHQSQPYCRNLIVTDWNFRIAHASVL